MRDHLLISLLVISSLAFTDVCYAEIWCNPANTGVEDGLTKATGYNTLWAAMSIMLSGDMVVIADGDWTEYQGMTIASDGHLPPSGTSPSNMTTIRAETDWGVKLTRLADLGTGRDYIVIRGIMFPGGGLYEWRYSKIVRCGFMGASAAGNVSTFSISHGEHNLVEECIAWGGGRYKFLDYLGNHNIFRRCVARHDWYISLDWKGQESNFRGYGCNNSVWQNCISVDSDRIEYQTPDGTSYEDGDFWVGDQSGADGNIITGCIVIKGLYQAYYLGGTDSGTDVVELTNSIALGPSLEGMAGLTGAITRGTPIITASNCLFYDFDAGNQHFIGHNKGSGSLNITNSIVWDVGLLNATADYMYYWNVTTGDYGPNSTNADPLTAGGLLYPVRIEESSPLYTAGEGGSICGPTILKKIGVSGTLYGEPGWDEITDADLWPFPNEDKIKELMSDTVDGVSGIYGFTAYNSPFGSPNTLTSYIWEYLGNAIPPDIYGDQPSPIAITTTSLPDGEAGSFYSQAVQVQGGTFPYTWSDSGNLPTDLSLDFVTGLISGTPTTAGISSFTVQVEDSATNTDSQALSITVRPSVPQDLVAVAISSTQIDLTWSASIGATGYKIYRDGIQVDTTASTSYSDAGLFPSTTYTYTISAYDAANESGQSTESLATTPPDTPAGATVFQNGSDGYSGCETNSLMMASSEVNNGAATYVTLDSTDDTKFGMIKFGNVVDGVNGIPSGSTIVSATLSVFQYNGYDSSGAMDLHSFIVNPVYGVSWGGINDAADECCWNYLAYDETRWGNNTQSGPLAGIDYDNASDANLSWTAAPAARWLEIDITGLVQEWVNGAANNGILIIPDAGVYTRFRAAPWDTVSERPKLTVEYTEGSTEPPGQPGKPTHFDDPN